MNNTPKVSDAEWQIMKVLWNESPLTASKIIERLTPDTSWSPKTIHTLISRLVKKGAVEVKKISPAHEFLPLISEGEIRRIETKSFIEKIYNGSLSMLLSNFINDDSLSTDEIEELKKILNKK